MKKHIITFLLTMSMVVGLLPVNLQGAVISKSERERTEEGRLTAPVIIEDSHVYAVPATTRKMAPAQGDDWKLYGSAYSYNQLTDKQKKFYDDLEGMCLTYATESLDVSLYEKTSGDGEITKMYTLPGVSYSGLKSGEVYQALYSFLFQNPQFFYLDKGYVINNSMEQVLSLTVYQEFAGGGIRTTAIDTMFSKVDELVEAVKAGSNEAEMERLAHDLIIQKVSYESSRFDQSAYSVFTGDKTVCAGYSQAFAILMNAVGVETSCTTSDAHEWNKVKLYENWYNVDLTWDDTDSGAGVRYLYYNRSDDEIKNISQDSKTFHTEESLWNSAQPAAETDSGATETDPGKLITQKITAEDEEMTLGDSLYLSAISSASGAAITYRSANPDIATIDSKSGMVTAKDTGRTSVIITAAETEDSLKAVSRIEITVVPRRVKIKNIQKLSGKAVRINWLTQEGSTGYEINLGDDETFSQGKTIYIEGGSINTRKVTNLTAGQDCWIRIRAVKVMDSGEKIKGAWSLAKVINALP